MPWRGAALALCLAVWLALTPRAATAADDIVLGVPTSLASLEGAESLRAVELAVAQINQAGGLKIGESRRNFRLEPFDLNDVQPGTPPQEAVARLRAFLERVKPHAILVGPFRSEVLLEAMDLLAEKKIPTLVSIAMSPAVDAKVLSDAKYRYIFRVGINSKYLAVYLIEAMRLLKQNFGFQKVFILNQDVAWSRSTASLMIKLYFDRAGWQVLGQESIAEGTEDFSPSLTRIKDQGAQVILALFDMPSSLGLVRQWHDLKPPAILCGFISPAVSPQAWTATHGRLAGLINVVFELGNLPAAKYPPASAFQEAFRARHGRSVQSGHGPAPAYESVYILAQALERAGTLEAGRVAQALEATDRQGAMGRVRFHRGHQVVFGEDPQDVALASVVQWAESGKRVIVYPESIAEGRIVLPAFVKPAQ
jgi:branched-chain amino acid transport system substrate-binding protein